MWMFYVVFLAIVDVIGGQSHGDGRHPLPPDASLNRARGRHPHPHPLLEMAEYRFRTSGGLSETFETQFLSSMFIQFSSHARALLLQVFLLVLIAVAVSVFVVVSGDT